MVPVKLLKKILVSSGRSPGVIFSIGVMNSKISFLCANRCGGSCSITSLIVTILLSSLRITYASGALYYLLFLSK
jgi:hypothetical protein